jgi:hypothetical protein
MASYKIVYSDRSDKTEFGCIPGEEVNIVKILEEKVNTYMSQGWQCIGGIIVNNLNGLTIRMYQTMIKIPV